MHTVLQYAFVALLLLMLGALTDPFMYWMPTMPQMAALGIATALLSAWIGFVAREKVNDERDEKHRMFAGRVAYLLGVSCLTTALIVETLAHSLTPWIPTTLAVMVVGKLAARWYADRFW